MIHIFDNIFYNSFIGLSIIIIISLENLILSRRKTLPVVILDQVFFSLIACLFGWPCIIYSVIFLGLLIFKKYHDKWYSDSAYLRFDKKLYSISLIINWFRSKSKNLKKQTIIGKILPVNYLDIKNNMRPIAVDETILRSGTMVTGSSGSGKNLYKNTIIPTPNGFIKLEDIKIGDIIYDEYKRETKVIDKYSPKEDKFYEIKFKDGTKIKAGGGHLWKVREYKTYKSYNKIVDTNYIYSNFFKNQYTIIREMPIDKSYSKKYFEFESIKPIDGNYEDYICLAVDSPTHMFLCTEKYIPTHNTTTIKSLIIQRLKHGHPVAFFDYKGEEEIMDELEAIANLLHVPYYEFSLRRCTFNYDPLINLNETGKVEAVLNMRKWASDNSDAHYKTSSQLYIQNLVRAYEEYRSNNPEELEKNYTVGLYEYTRVYKPQKSELDGYQTTVKILEILLTSKAKEMFSKGLDEFNFYMNKQFLVVFSFVSSNKSLASSLSSFVYQDIMDRGTKKQYNPELFLAIDEFGTLENSMIIKDIFEKGRSGGIQTMLSILDINQIAMTTSDHFVQAILGTINNAIIHAGATKQTAELVSGMSKFENEYDIMSLTKPYKRIAPTVLHISKYPILNKKGGQEVHRLLPYIEKVNIKRRKSVVSVPQEIKIPDIPEIEPVHIDVPIIEESKQEQQTIFETDELYKYL